MNIQMYKIEIIEFDWSTYSGPEYYKPENVPQTLIELLELDDENLNSSVYNKVLFAIGNNHGGTYYPAIEKALKYIIATALNGNSEIARSCSLNILIDLYASFDPELGNYNYISFEELKVKVKQEIESISFDLEAFSSNLIESSRNKNLAIELLECINETE